MSPWTGRDWIEDRVSFDDYFTAARVDAEAEAREYVDRLGPATPETRAEVKATPARRAFNAVLMTVVLIVTGLVPMGAGVYIGATNPSVWTDLPFTPEPSGERAEPEESAR